MSTNGHQPGAQDREPLRADEWLEAPATPATASQRSPFARGRATNGTRRHAPPPPAPTSEDDDPTSLPIFAGAWASDDQLPGRARSEFTLRPLVASARSPSRTRATPTTPTHGVARSSWTGSSIAQYRAEISSRLTARLDKEGGRVTEEDREQMGLEVIEELDQVRGREPRLDRPPAVEPPAGEGTQGRARGRTVRPGPAAAAGRARGRGEHHRHRPRPGLLGVAGARSTAPWSTAAPIADSEDELREFLADLGSRQNRPFTEARPTPGPAPARRRPARGRLLGHRQHLGGDPPPRDARGLDGRDGLRPQGVRPGPGRLPRRLRARRQEHRRLRRPGLAARPPGSARCARASRPGR